MSAVLVPDPPREGTRFPALDSLRAVGALGVLTTHVTFLTGDYTTNGSWGALLARLDVGVALFFVLSGFLLARPWLVATDVARPETIPYLWKRVLRIMPLYVVTVVLALLLVPQQSPVSLGDWASSLLMLDTFTAPALPLGLTHMWSLAVEMTFYLALPLVMLVLIGRRRRPHPPTIRVLTGLLGLLALTVLWLSVGAGHAGELRTGAPGQWLPGYLSWFGAGILLALVEVLHRQGVARRLTSPFVALGAHPGVCWSLALGLMLVAASPVAGPTSLDPATPTEAVTKNLVYAVVGLLVVLTGVFPVAGAYRRVLSLPVVRRLGFISFGVFCLHMPILSLVMAATSWETFQAPFLGLFPLTLLLSVLAAELAYRLLELPMMRLRHVGPGRGRRDRRRHRAGDGSDGSDGSTRVDPTTSSAATGTTTR